MIVVDGTTVTVLLWEFAASLGASYALGHEVAARTSALSRLRII